MKKFAQWVLDIGDGKVLTPASEIEWCHEDDIVILAQFCDLNNENYVENMLKAIFPDFIQNCQDPKYLSVRVILTPTNQTVARINSLIVEKLPGDVLSYFSADSAEDFCDTEDDLNNAFPIEYLNSLSLPCMPVYESKLKVGVVVMLMRNLNQTLGLCNRSRMTITKCLKFCVECKVICGSLNGTGHFIPRMELCSSETRMPFKLVRKQMPLQLFYAMTMNKSQGQSLQHVGLFLLKACFTHG